MSVNYKIETMAMLACDICSRDKQSKTHGDVIHLSL